jgi:hypothetical protein
LEFDHEEKKRKKMVVTIFDKGKIIFLEMEKFQRWIIGRNLGWARHINVSNLLNMQLSPIHPLVKEFLQAII